MQAELPDEEREGWPGQPLTGVALALAAGLAGGFLFNWLTMPLPWLLGAMAANTVAALFGLPIRSPRRVRPHVVVVIGVMLGSGFTPDFLGQVQLWLVSFLFLALYLAIAGAVAVPFYLRVGRFDPVSAFFAGMPGGLTEMMLIGGAMGGDERKIVLAHAARIFIVVGLIAIWFRLLAGYDLGDRSRFGVAFAEVPWQQLLILTACGIAGYVLGLRLGLPAPTLIGPMMVSAAAHLTGFAHSAPPRELVSLAQLVIGTVIGCRFAGARPAEIGSALGLGLAATLLTVSVTLAFALLFHGLFGQTIEQVLLAYSPGGLAEMSLVALAMQADVAYVASHHVVRITLVILFAPLVFRLLRRP